MVRMVSQTFTSATGRQILKTVLTPGDGLHTPTEGSTCTLHIDTISVPDGVTVPILNQKDENTLTLTLGHYDTYYGEAIHLVAGSMKHAEKCQVNIPSDAQESSSDSNERGDSSPNQEIILAMTLSSFEPATETWRLSPEEQLAFAVALKTQGNTFFQKGSKELAFSKYSRSLKYLLCMDAGVDIPDKIAAEVKKLKCQCYLNLSACQLQSKNYAAVIQNCTEALGLDPDSVKGLYRRSQGHIRLRSFDLAQEDLKVAATLEPQNKAVQKSLAYVCDVLKKQDGKMASAMSKLFT